MRLISPDVLVDRLQYRVGWIRQQQIDGLRQWPQPVAMQQRYAIAKSMPLDVRPRNLERRFRKIHGPDMGPRQVRRHRYRDGAASRADVGNCECLVAGKTSTGRECKVDQKLRLRPWHEHAPIDVERQPIEFTLSDQIRDRLQFNSAGDELGQTLACTL